MVFPCKVKCVGLELKGSGGLTHREKLSGDLLVYCAKSYDTHKHNFISRQNIHDDNTRRKYTLDFKQHSCYLQTSYSTLCMVYSMVSLSRVQWKCGIHYPFSILSLSEIKMATSMEKSLTRKDEDDEEDLEALRMAALQSLRKKAALPPPAPVSIFQPHLGNPNLIAIIPEGAVHKPQKSNFFRVPVARPHPFHPHVRHPAPAAGSTIGSSLKVLPRVQVHKPSPGPERRADDKEEVSTKFSRFEDTESESEDESETEEKESESSDESDDVLALEDDDDSLEALMAQMEHEIEVGIDPEPSKKDKKKGKSGKTKEKETKVRVEDKNNLEKVKSETKTAVVEPTVKEAVEVRVVKFDNRQNRKSPSPGTTRAVSPVKIHPLNTNSSRPEEIAVKVQSPRTRSPILRTPSPVRQQSPSPKPRLRTPPRTSPQRARSPILRVISKSRSPLKQRSLSPRSPVRSKSPVLRGLSPARRKSPRKLSPDRRSPLRRSPDRYFSGKKSPSPYYKTRDYRRSRSPLRRRSISPRKSQRESFPRKSRSPPWSPFYRRSPRSPSPRYRSRSPVRRRSLSPRGRKYKPYPPHSPVWNSPKRRSLTPSPRRSNSPRKRDYSPRRRPVSPRRDFVYRRSSVSPKRNSSPPFKKYSPQRSPKQKRSSPRRNISPRRRPSPVPLRESRRIDHKSRTPSLSLSPSPPRESKDQPRRYKSPLRPRKESGENINNGTSRGRRAPSVDKASDKEKRKLNSKAWERDREGRAWDRKVEDRRKERAEKTDKEPKRERENNRAEKQKREDPKEDPSLKVSDNPVFEARRKKFESTAVIEPASKKIRLVTKRDSPVEEKAKEPKELKLEVVEEKKIVENSVQTEDDLFSGHEEIDEIDSFLNEDVLDLSAEVWSSDDDLFPKANKTKAKVPAKAKVAAKAKPQVKHPIIKERTFTKEKKVHKSKTRSQSPAPAPVAAVVKSKVGSPLSASPSNRSPEAEPEEKSRDDSDLRAELSRRREERLTKAGSLHEKLPARLLQSAFESALGTKKTKKEGKLKKSEKEVINKESSSPPPPREKSDGRRVLVLKKPAPVRMQSAHINVTFPKGKRDDTESESESESYSSSSSEDERYTTAAAKRKLPIYMRLGTAQRKRQTTGGRKVKFPSRRSQV